MWGKIEYRSLHMFRDYNTFNKHGVLKLKKLASIETNDQVCGAILMMSKIPGQ